MDVASNFWDGELVTFGFSWSPPPLPERMRPAPPEPKDPCRGVVGLWGLKCNVTEDAIVSTVGNYGYF